VGAPPPALPGPGFTAPAAPAAPSIAPPPDLGVADGGFGGVEMDFSGGRGSRGGKSRRSRRRRGKRLKVAKESGFLSKPINRITVGLLAVTFLLILGNEFKKTVSGGGASSSEVTPAAVAAAPSGEAGAVDPFTASSIERMMAEGMELFQKGKYFDATAKFLKVLKMDPSHEGAKRMGYLSCEFIAIKEMQKTVAERAMGDAEREKIKGDALAAGREALENSWKINGAIKTINEALESIPDDQELTDLRDKLKQKQAGIAVAVTRNNQKKLSEEVEKIYQQGKAELDRRNYTNAIGTFERVLAKDADRSTEFYYQAEEGIRQAKQKMRQDAQGPYKDGVAKMREQNFLGARASLREALRLDPYYSAAQTKLVECQRQLEQIAVTEYSKGRVMEQANQPQKALQHYRQVLALVDDRSNSTYKNADARIKALLE